MNMKRNHRSLLGPATLFCAVVFMLSTVPTLAKSPSQTLRGHVPSAVSSGQAKLVGSLPSKQRLSLSIVLPLRNQAALDTLLGQLYDPSSPSYRQFLSVAQFTEQFGPTVEDYQTVVDFAKANGFTVTDTPTNRLIVPIIGTAAQIEKAFNVKMNIYQHPTENRTFYSLDREPALDLSVPVLHISGLNNFSIPRPALTKATNEQAITNTTGSGPSGGFLPSDMRAAYYGGTALTGSGECVGLMEYGGYNINDVALTFDGAATWSTNGSNYILSYTTGGINYKIPINNVPLDGASVGTYNGDEIEVALDIAQVIGMAPGLSQVRVYFTPDVWTESGSYIFPGSSNDTLIFNTMANENACKQVSISWNWNPENIYSNDGILQEMAAQGQSIFNASGDSGSWPNEGCYAPHGCYYPEEDAYVTAVGGTDLTTTGPGGSWVSETAWSRSGGGISPDGVPIPSWQSGIVGVNGASGIYRNAPDVAMEANTDNYYCSFGSCATGEGGTSYAAPRWAGFMALVNQQAVAAGVAPKGGLGFINPLIYEIGESSSYDSDFHDITSDCNGAYCAGYGYDLVTGWGSPNGQNLINALAPKPTVATTATLVDHQRSTQPYVAGDSFTLTITGAPNQTVTVDQNNGGFTTCCGWATNASGVLVINGSWAASNVGTYNQIWAVGGIPAPAINFQIVPATTATLVDHQRSTQPYVAGDSFTLTITGAPNQTVTVDQNNGGFTTCCGWATNASGVLVINGSWAGSNVGTYNQIWAVGGIPAPAINFQVAPVVTLVDNQRSTQPYLVGDTFTLTVIGTPNQTVTVDQNNGGFTTCCGWATNASGVLVINGSWAASNVGTYNQIWAVGGIPAVPQINFQVAQ